MTHRVDAGIGELAGDDGGLVASLGVDDLVALLGDLGLETEIRSGQIMVRSKVRLNCSGRGGSLMR